MQGWRGWRTAVIAALLGVFLPGTGLLAQAPPASPVPPSGQSAAAKGATAATEETCRVSGLVLKMSDGSPLKNAMVQLYTEADREHTIATKTTADGRFALQNVPAGRYKLSVSRNGYVTTEYGQKKPSDPGAAFTLRAEESRQDLVFKLIPAGAISGRGC